MPPPRPPVNHSGQVVTIDWNPPTYGGCSGSPQIDVRLTVVGTLGQTDTETEDVRIDLRASPEREELTASFISEMASSDGESLGFILLNGARRDFSSSAAPSSHTFRGFAGPNTIEAGIQGTSLSPILWKFDFSAAMHFVAGSLEVERGAVAAIDGRAIVFRLAGVPGERIRFRFELSR
jgi:hypothetical protein